MNTGVQQKGVNDVTRKLKKKAQPWVVDAKQQVEGKYWVNQNMFDPAPIRVQNVDRKKRKINTHGGGD